MRRTLGFAAVVAAYIALNTVIAHAEDFTGKVTSVSSAHIVQVEHDGKREIVVLNGIASPDSKTPEGKQAKAFVANRALDQEVKVEVIKRSDRIVTGTVFLPDGTDLAQWVLSEGMGTWNRLTAPDNTRYRDLEAGAKMQNLGLWEMDVAPAKPAERVKPNKTDVTKAETEQPAKGKKIKLVLRGDPDVAEAAHAQFEREQQAVGEERARQATEQQRLLIEQERQFIAEQKRNEVAAIKADQEAQAIMPDDMASQDGDPPQ